MRSELLSVLSSFIVKLLVLAMYFGLVLVHPATVQRVPSAKSSLDNLEGSVVVAKSLLP